MSVLDLPGVSVTSALIELEASVRCSGADGQGAAPQWDWSQSTFQFIPELLNVCDTKLGNLV